MHVVDGVDVEVVLVEAGDDGDLLAVGLLVELVDGGHVDPALVGCAVGLDCCELQDDGVAQREVLLRQQLVHVRLDLRLHDLMLAHDGHRQFSDRLRPLAPGMPLPDLKLSHNLLLRRAGHNGDKHQYALEYHLIIMSPTSCV